MPIDDMLIKSIVKEKENEMSKSKGKGRPKKFPNKFIWAIAPNNVLTLKMVRWNSFRKAFVEVTYLENGATYFGKQKPKGVIVFESVEQALANQPRVEVKVEQIEVVGL